MCSYVKPHLFLPVIHVRNRRWRVRMRWLPDGWTVKRKNQAFPQGSVYTLWLGPLLVVAMVDTHHGWGFSRFWQRWMR